MCEFVVITRNYHAITFLQHRFQLNVDRIELTLGVSIPQEVAPGTTYDILGETEFQSLPDDNILNVSPRLCSNSTLGSVKINPVVLNPWFIHWSDADTTQNESLATTQDITIGDQFNMTIMVCMPESITSVRLLVLLPNINSVPLVTVNDTYVTFIGSELYNTILSEGDCKYHACLLIRLSPFHVKNSIPLIINCPIILYIRVLLSY